MCEREEKIIRQVEFGFSIPKGYVWQGFLDTPSQINLGNNNILPIRGLRDVGIIINDDNSLVHVITPYSKKQFTLGGSLLNVLFGEEDNRYLVYDKSYPRTSIKGKFFDVFVIMIPSVVKSIYTYEDFLWLFYCKTL